MKNASTIVVVLPIFTPNISDFVAGCFGIILQFVSSSSKQCWLTRAVPELTKDRSQGDHLHLALERWKKTGILIAVCGRRK